VSECARARERERGENLLGTRLHTVWNGNVRFWCFFFWVSRQALGPTRTASTLSSSSVGSVASCHHLTRHTDITGDVTHLARSRAHELDIASGARTRGNGGGTTTYVPAANYIPHGVETVNRGTPPPAPPHQRRPAEGVGGASVGEEIEGGRFNPSRRGSISGFEEGSPSTNSKIVRIPSSRFSANVAERTMDVLTGVDEDRSQHTLIDKESTGAEALPFESLSRCASAPGQSHLGTGT